MSIQPGTIVILDRDKDYVSLSVTPANGGTGNYTYEFQRANNVQGEPGPWSNIGQNFDNVWERYGNEFASIGNYEASNPNVFFSANQHVYNLNPNTGTATYTSFGFQGGVIHGSEEQGVHGPVRVIKLNGNTFVFISIGDGIQIYRPQGNILHLVSLIGGGNPGPDGTVTSPTIGKWTWADETGTGIPTPDTINWYEPAILNGSYPSLLGIQIDNNGNLLFPTQDFGTDGIYTIPVTFNNIGNPTYDWADYSLLFKDNSSLALLPTSVCRSADGALYILGFSTPWPYNGNFWGGTTLLKVVGGSIVWTIEIPGSIGVAGTCSGMDVIPTNAGLILGIFHNEYNVGYFLHYTADGLLIGYFSPGQKLGRDGGWLDNQGSVAVNRNSNTGLIDVFTEDDYTDRIAWYQINDTNLHTITTLTTGPDTVTFISNVVTVNLTTPAIVGIGIYDSNNILVKPLISQCSLPLPTTIVDTITKGSWGGIYGTDGYFVVYGGEVDPPYTSQALILNASGAPWSEYSFTNLQDLQQTPNSAQRVSAAWVSDTYLSLAINFLDNQKHQLSIYLLDWDNLGRTQTVQVIDDLTGLVLTTYNASNFSQGLWLTWNLTGKIKITITATGPGNAVLNGWFFDPISNTSPTSSSTNFTWDHTDQFGNTAPSGTYTVKVAVNRSIYTCLGAIGNSGNPSKGAIDHTPINFDAIISDTNNNVYTANNWDESGEDFTKFASDNTKTRYNPYQLRNGNPNALSYNITTDSTYLYIAATGSEDDVHLSQPQMIWRFNLDGTPNLYTDPSTTLGHIYLYQYTKNLISGGVSTEDYNLLQYPINGMACYGGNLYISDTLGNRIVIFDNTGLQINQTTIQFPLSISISSNGDIYVAHEHTKISVISGSNTTLIGQNFTDIKSINFNSINNSLYVTDNNCVSIYQIVSQSLTLQTTLGIPAKPGDRAADHFYSLYGAIVDKQNNIYTIQEEPLPYALGGSRLAKFTSSKNFIDKNILPNSYWYRCLVTDTSNSSAYSDPMLILVSTTNFVVNSPASVSLNNTVSIVVTPDPAADVIFDPDLVFNFELNGNLLGTVTAGDSAVKIIANITFSTLGVNTLKISSGDADEDGDISQISTYNINVINYQFNTTSCPPKQYCQAAYVDGCVSSQLINGAFLPSITVCQQFANRQIL